MLPWPHFSGNFWWASCRHVLRVPFPQLPSAAWRAAWKDTYQHPPLDRFYAEVHLSIANCSGISQFGFSATGLDSGRQQLAGEGQDVPPHRRTTGTLQRRVQHFHHPRPAVSVAERTIKTFDYSTKVPRSLRLHIGEKCGTWVRRLRHESKGQRGL